jgi:formylglycine-generating enzyme required for sulfatase activity
MGRILFLSGLIISGLFAGIGKVTISSAAIGAIVYVDGEKNTTIDKTPVTLLLNEGVHEIMVSRVMDEDWQEVQRQNVKVQSTVTIPLQFSLNLEKISKKTNKGKSENFIKNGDIVEDTVTHLIWQDNKSVTEVKKNWEEAQKYCDTLSLGDNDTWRLPTYDELITIVDYNKHTLAAMPAFQHVLSEYYWSSDMDKENNNNAKNIYFGNGCPNSNSKFETYYVRCVKTK